MNMTVLCYKKCSTCQKALKWLDANGIQYQERPIKEEHPSEAELKAWYEKSDGMLVKRPLVVADDFVLTGFKEGEWKEKMM